MASTRIEDVLLPPPVAEVLAHPERRRRWTPEQKLRLVIETLAPDASLSRIARRHGVHSSVLFRWRRQLATRVPGAQAAVAPAGGGLPRLAPVRVAPTLPESVPLAASTPTAVPALHLAASLPLPVAAETSAADSAADAGRMEIELAGGTRVRVDRHVDADALRRVLAALAGTGPVAP